MSKIKQATEYTIKRIAKCQQNYVAFGFIVESLPNKVRTDNSAAIGAVSLALTQELLTAWEQLAWLAPVSKQAFDLLGERTRTWFGRDDTAVMGLLGYDGVYYQADKQKFLKEVREIFGVEKEGDNDIKTE